MKKFLSLLSIPMVCLILAMVPYGSIHAASAFTHSHNSSCYSMVTFTCTINHNTSKKTENDGSLKHCYTCNAQRSHYLVSYYASCQYVSGTYFTKAEYVCSVCGRVHAAWGPGQSHTASRQEMTCGIAEGTAMGTVSVSAGQTGWTNQNVTLHASINKQHNAFAAGANPYSWDRGRTWTASSSFDVSQNGTYVVQAKDSQGKIAEIGISVGNIDKIPPVIQGVDADTGSMTKTEITVTVNATDAAAVAGLASSGLADAAYSADGGAAWQSSPVFLLKEGRAYELVVRDRAGNEARQSVSRSQFPYPPEPEKPQPEDTPSSGSGSQLGDHEQENGGAADTPSSGGSQSGNHEQENAGAADTPSSGSGSQSGNHEQGNAGAADTPSSGSGSQSGNHEQGNAGAADTSSSGSGSQSGINNPGNAGAGNDVSSGGTVQPAGADTGSGAFRDGGRQENEEQAEKVKRPGSKGKNSPDSSKNNEKITSDIEKTTGNHRNTPTKWEQELKRRTNMIWVEKDIMSGAGSRFSQAGQNRADSGPAAETKQPVKVEKQETDKNNMNIEETGRQEFGGQAGADGGSRNQAADIFQGGLLEDTHDLHLSGGAKAAGSVLALGLAAAVLAVRMGRVTVYCYRADRRYTRLGMVRVRKTRKGYEARISDRLLQKASTGKYRIFVHRFLRRSSKNNGFTVITPKRELTLSLEEFVDFAL